MSAKPGTGTSDPVSGIGDPAPGGLPEPVLDATGDMSFMDHLGVLRRHITRSMLWFGLAAIIAFLVVGHVWDLMMIPLCDVMPERCYVYPRDLLESFWVYVKLGCLIAFFVAFPALFAEVWAFVAPGLYAHEKKIIIPFSLSAGLLFLGGACFGFFVIFPISLKFLISMETGGTFFFLTSMQSYFSLCATLLIAAGVVFELPLLMMGLSLVGLVRPRWYRRYRRLMYIAMLIFSAIATPTTDPVTMVLMGGPMLLLYEVGILLSVLVWRKRDASAAAAPAT